MSFDLARSLLRAAHAARAFPAAVIEVGNAGGPRWQEAFGRLTYDEDATAADLDTVFDLASLTKVIGTASLAMRAVAEGRLTLASRLAELLPDCVNPSDGAPVTVEHLLDHSSGLPAHARLWEQVSGRQPYQDALCALPRERPPGTTAVYSDPGFMLLGLAVERVLERTLDVLIDPITRLTSDALTYLPPESWRSRTAPTEFDPWRGRVVTGEVHDENAAAMGGVAGHAGLFGTAPAVGAFARLVLRTFDEETPLGTPALMRRFATRASVPGSSRALAWDTMLPTSSCGTRLSPTSIGHTGFTGTSLWIDPERDAYVVLLTNRVHPSRANDALVKLRPRVHDAVAEELWK